MSSNIFQSVYGFTNQVLTFYMPIFYTFKYLKEKDKGKVNTILKFWVILSCYLLLSFILKQLMDDKIFPFLNIIILVVLNIPPYAIADNIYESTIGPVYRKNKQMIHSIEQKIKELFNKNTETIKNKMKDSTNERMKGFVGQVLMATINPNQSRTSSSSGSRYDSDSQNDKED